MKNKLRIGILIDTYEIPAWSYKMLSEINHSTCCDLVLIVKNKHRRIEDQRILMKAYRDRKKLVYLLYRKLDRKFFRGKPDAFEVKNIKDLNHIPIIEIQPITTNYYQHFSKRDSNKIKEHSVDVFVKLGFETLENSVLKLAKYGFWAFHFGDDNNNLSRPYGFWEVVEKWDETGVTLHMFSTGGKKRVLVKSTTLTDQISVERSLNNLYWKSVTLLPRKLEELYRLDEDVFFDRIDELNKHPKFYFNEIRAIPSNGEAILKLISFKWRRIRNILKAFFYTDQWLLMYNISASKTLSTNINQFKKIEPPKDRIWADPHIIWKNGSYYIFIEELIVSENKGFISVIKMDDQGNYTTPIKVLEENYHLSFPFIIEDKENIYMIPESKENNNIKLYKCIDFPYTWELEKVLIDKISAVDTVIIYLNDKYWLFTNVVKNKGASPNDELFLYWSDDLVSNNWVSHPENPIVSDVKKARMAGGLFSYHGNLYRPSQNCSKHYGYGMQLNQVLEINENIYKEQTVNSIYPNWDKNVKSTHSLSYIQNLTIIDACFKVKK